MQTKLQRKLVLYDLKTARGGDCLSPRTWRLRLALNYKEIPYRTEWLELPDIKSKGQEIGAPPTALDPDGSGSSFWTVPMLVDPNHLDSHGNATVLADSTPIVEYLDKVYPKKKVIPEGTSALIAAWEQFIECEVVLKIYRLIVPLTPRVLAKPSQDYFYETRQKWWGPLGQICPDRPKSMAEIHEGLDNVAKVLEVDGTCLTVMPEARTYADFLLAAPLLWAEGVLGDDELKEIRSWNDGKFGLILDDLKKQGLLHVD